MRPNGPPSFTPTLLHELISMRRLLQRLFAGLRPGEAAPVKYFVGGSRIPGMYNLGGDLNFFIRSIRARNIDALRSYAHDCVDVAYHMMMGPPNTGRISKPTASVGPMPASEAR